MSTGVAKGFHEVAQSPASGTQRITFKGGQPPPGLATILDHIAVYLGPLGAHAMITSCCRAIGREPEAVEFQDVPKLLIALHPTLSTLLGGASARIVLRRIERDLALSSGGAIV